MYEFGWERVACLWWSLVLPRITGCQMAFSTCTIILTVLYCVHVPSELVSASVPERILHEESWSTDLPRALSHEGQPILLAGFVVIGTRHARCKPRLLTTDGRNNGAETLLYC